MTEDELSPIFYCPLCPGPVYTPYMEHHDEFHPDFPPINISSGRDGKSNGAVIKPRVQNTKNNSLP